MRSIKKLLGRFVAWLSRPKIIEHRFVDVPEIRIVVEFAQPITLEEADEVVQKAIESHTGLRPIDEHFARHTKVLANSDLITKR